MIDADDIAVARILALGLAGGVERSPMDVVAHLLCMQGQILPGVLASVALRTVDGDVAAVTAALDEGHLVRSWTQRGTIHLVGADDIGWILDLTSERMLRSMTRRRAQLGIDDDMLDRAIDLAAALIAEQGPVSRAALLAAWEPLGVAETAGRGYHLIVSLAIRQVLVQGPCAPGGRTEQLFALSADWLRQQRRLPREEALEELATRYVRGHGPATDADAARWAGLPVTEVRRGIAAAHNAGAITSTAIDGETYWHAPELPDLLADHRDETLRTLLLPGFDELILGYRDRSATLAPADEKLVVPGGNGMFKNTIIDRGRAVATWTRSSRRSGPRVEATAFPGRRLSRRRIEQAAAAHPAFG